MEILRVEKQIRDSWPVRLAQIPPKSKAYVDLVDKGVVRAVLSGRMKKYHPEMVFTTKKVHVKEGEEIIPYLMVERLS